MHGGGDTLCVPTVASFASGACDLWLKMQSLSGRGVGFQSGCERYLNFSSTSPLPAVVAETLKAFASREAGVVRWGQCSSLPDAAKVALAGHIRAEFVADIALVFQNNGIRKKGGNGLCPVGVPAPVRCFVWRSFICRYQEMSIP